MPKRSPGHDFVAFFRSADDAAGDQAGDLHHCVPLIVRRGQGHGAKFIVEHGLVLVGGIEFPW